MNDINYKNDEIKEQREYQEVEFKTNYDFKKGYIIREKGNCKEIIILNENDVRISVFIGQNEKIKTIEEFNEKCSDLFKITLIKEKC